MTWFNNVDFSKVTVKHRWNGMADRFDVEQGILSCWNVTGDIDLLYKKVMDGDMSKDDIANFLLGLKTIYDAKFDTTFNDFEESIHNDCKKEQELKRKIEASQAKIDALMLEYCPDEVTGEQMEEYSKHQVAVDLPAETVRTNLDIIIKSSRHLVDKQFVEVSTGKKYTFVGVIVGSDDYYYGMSSKKNGLVQLSCAGSINGYGFELIE